MGRNPVLTLLLLGAASGALAACGDAVRREADDPHANLACRTCHDGGLADLGEAAVPSESCSGSRCHALSLPDEVSLATVRFTHRGHGSDSEVAVGCAGCHTHSSGSRPLRAGPETCGLCHVREVSSTRGEACRVCHANPNHAGTTSQGLAVPHQGLPWIEGGCLRCHYAVAEPVQDVSLTRCTRCHRDVEAVTRAGIGEDLHPSHTGIACARCHEADNHRIQAMSSAVNLTCATCHDVEHEVEVRQPWLDPQTCNTCHHDAHQAPQRLLLGILPGDAAAAPSDHFMDGLTCRSCHQPDPGRADGRQRGTGEGCVACHREEYRTVLRWWGEGIDARTRLVDAYIGVAERALGGTDPEEARLIEARGLLNAVVQGGGQHNLPLTHRLLDDALQRTADAYAAAGRRAPPTPALGRAPRQGLCTYCHYRLDEPGLTVNMNDRFHREVIGR